MWLVFSCMAPNLYGTIEEERGTHVIMIDEEWAESTTIAMPDGSRSMSILDWIKSVGRAAEQDVHVDTDDADDEGTVIARMLVEAADDVDVQGVRRVPFVHVRVFGRGVL